VVPESGDGMNVEIPQRRPSEKSEDDQVQPFQVDALDVRGRTVRLGPALNGVLAHHDYPDPVARVVAEATTLGVLLGSTLKDAGRFILQTQTDGAVDMIVVDVVAPDRVRAYARFDEAKVEELAKQGVGGAGLLGRGHLAMTIEPGGSDPNRYQGVVPLEGEGLEVAAHRYFTQSEQIPTKLRIAVGEEMHAGSKKTSWRAGGVLAQFLPREGGRAIPADLDPGDAPEGFQRDQVEEDDAWVEAQSLVETVEDHELLDPSLSSERLLYRLFNERGVRVFDQQKVTAHCTCSRERVSSLLQGFPESDRTDMIEDGKVAVTCEFCGRKYSFDPAEIES
jgi:molecular chaperone Hsp33